MFETISLFELKKEIEDLYYIGKGTSKQGFDLVLLDSYTNYVWIGECKWRVDGTGLNEIFNKFLQKGEQSTNEENELYQIIENLRTVDIQKIQYLNDENQREKLMDVLIHYMNKKENIENFIASAGASKYFANKKINW